MPGRTTIARAAAAAAVGVVLSTLSPALAQPAVGQGTLPAFEYASVLPSHAAAGPVLSVSPGTGDFTAIGVTVSELIGFAYDVRPSDLVGGPDWLYSAHYQVEARPPESFAGKDRRSMAGEVRQLVQGLLLDHFGLEREQLGLHLRSVPVDVVVIDRVSGQPEEGNEGRVFELVSPTR